jgi:hypothetical protein
VDRGEGPRQLDLVFQTAGTEGLYALDARTGNVLHRYRDARARIRADPLTYMANDKQLLAVAATNKIVTLGHA